MIISDGYNGNSFFAENCWKTKAEQPLLMLHAETKYHLKLASRYSVCKGATLFTLSPCKEMQQTYVQSGIKRLVYIDQYSDAELKF